MAITVSKITPNAGQFVKNGDNISFTIQQSVYDMAALGYYPEISVYALTSTDLLNNNWYVYTVSSYPKVWMLDTSTLFQHDLIKIFPNQALDTNFSIPFVLNNNVLSLDKSGLYDYTNLPIDQYNHRVFQSLPILPASYNPNSSALQVGLRWRDYFTITFPPHNTPFDSPPVISSWVGGNPVVISLNAPSYLSTFGLLEQSSNNQKYYTMKTGVGLSTDLMASNHSGNNYPLLARYLAVSPSYWLGDHPSGYSSDQWYVYSMPDGWQTREVLGQFMGIIQTV